MSNIDPVEFLEDNKHFVDKHFDHMLKFSQNNGNEHTHILNYLCCSYFSCNYADLNFILHNLEMPPNVKYDFFVMTFSLMMISVYLGEFEDIEISTVAIKEDKNPISDTCLAIKRIEDSYTDPLEDLIEEILEEFASDYEELSNPEVIVDTIRDFEILDYDYPEEDAEGYGVIYIFPKLMIPKMIEDSPINKAFSLNIS